MKRALTLMLMALSAPGLWADSIKFTETYTDKAVAYTESGCPECTWYGTVPTDVATLNVSVTIPGAKNFPMNEWTTISVWLGDFHFEAMLGYADSGVPNSSATFIDRDEKGAELGRITFSRKGDVLGIVATHKNLMYSDSEGERSAFVSSSYVDWAAPGETTAISDQTEFGFSFMDYYSGMDEPLEFSRTVYYKGTAKVISKTFGSGDTATELNLNTITITGEADTTPPKVTLTAPKTGTTTTEDAAHVTGKATDNVEVSYVWLVVSNAFGTDYFDAVLEEEGTFSGDVMLAPGNNTIFAYAEDVAGNESLPAITKVYYLLRSAVTLQITPDNGGTLTGITNGQMLEVGKSYKLTAKPVAGKVFAGWESSGILEVSNRMSPTLVFVMEEDLTLTAKFMSNPFRPLAGTYNGLVTPDMENWSFLESSNCGSFTLTLTTNGAGSGKIIMPGQTLTIPSVLIDPESFVAEFNIPMGKGVPYTVHLELPSPDSGGTAIYGQIERNIQAYDWMPETERLMVAAYKAQAATNFAGKYTIVLPGLEPGDYDEVPGGDGYGTITVDAKGGVKLNATLSENTVFNTSGSLIKRSDDLAVYPLYFGQKNKTILIGWLYFAANAQAWEQVGVELPGDVTAYNIYGNLQWDKSCSSSSSSSSSQQYYFSEWVEVVGAKYTKPAAGQNGLGWTSGYVSVGRGNLEEYVSYPLNWVNNKFVTDPAWPGFTFTLTADTGLFTGSFTNPTTNKKVTFKGAILQLPDGLAWGGAMFMDGGKSGFVEFSPVSLE